MELVLFELNKNSANVEGTATSTKEASAQQSKACNSGISKINELYLECFNQHEPSITVIGGGRMATALVQGFVRTGCIDRSRVFVCTGTKESADKWRQLGYLCAYPSAEFYKEVRKPAAIVLVAIKPQTFSKFLEQMRQNEWFYFGTPELLCVSIMAGISLQYFTEQLKTVGFEGHSARLMPNLNCAVSAGTLLVSLDRKTTPGEHVQLLIALGSTVGYCVYVDEAQFNAASAISGCGPAFVSMVIEAIADGGVLSGLNRELANRLATETVKGTAQYLLNSTSVDSTTSISSPAQIKDLVCSPAGTTIAGVHELEKGAVRSAFIEAVHASTRRAAELSGNR